MNTRVQGNIIGLAADGFTPVATSQTTGVLMLGGGSGTVVGGADAGAGNVISGNGGTGVHIGAGMTGNLVQGNLIGLTASGAVPVVAGSSPPSLARWQTTGVHIAGGSSNTIGGSTEAARNVISGHGNYGVRIDNASSNAISGNYIGTAKDGNALLGLGSTPYDGSGSAFYGVYIGPGSTNNIVGGLTATPGTGAGNVISGHYDGVIASNSLPDSHIGIWINGASSTTVAGNVVGLNAAGTAALPNGYGIQITGANNVVGGTDAQARNVISGNIDFSKAVTGTAFGGSGVTIGAGASGTSVLNNFIGTNLSGSALFVGTVKGVTVFGNYGAGITRVVAQ